MKETQFIDDRTLRDNSVNHYEVLEKVKELFLLPGTELATLKLVADFYEVDEKAIEKVYTRHFDELESDGMCSKKYSELSNLQYVGLKNSRICLDLFRKIEPLIFLVFIRVSSNIEIFLI